MTDRITAPIKYPGAKWSYAEWICSYLPPHRFYLKPFFGSGAVFFTKSPAVYETINDLDSQVVNFFRVCREMPEDLARMVERGIYDLSTWWRGCSSCRRRPACLIASECCNSPKNPPQRMKSQSATSS